MTYSPTWTDQALDETQASILYAALEQAKADEHVIYIAVKIALWAGLRLGEVLALTWRNVHLLEAGESFLVVNRALKMVKGPDEKYVPEFGKPKSKAGYRTIPIPETLVEALRYEKDRQADNRRFFGEHYRENDLVCCDSDGSPYLRWDIQKPFARFARKHGFKIRFHDLRHTFGTLMANTGIPAPYL